MHENNCFITLTYNNENLPEDLGLLHDDYKTFDKALRYHLSERKINPDTGRLKRYYHPFKYYMCGEYGYVRDPITHEPLEDSLGRKIIGRPHYHACLFNVDFDDKWLWRERDGIPLYRSPTLEKLWTKGYSSIGAVTFESAAYIARYCTKKINGEREEELCHLGLKHYERLTENGEIIAVKPEYTNMSRRRGIGLDFFETYGKSDIIPHDSVIVRGKEMQPPRYYTNLIERDDPETFLRIKNKRKRQQELRADDNTQDRLDDKRKVKLAQISQLHRNL